MKPLVAMVTPYYEPVTGGITSFIRGLTRSLRMSGAEVTVLTRDGVEGHGVRTLHGKPTDFVVAAVKALNDLKPDVVHAHAHWYALAAATLVRGKGTQPRLVFSFHTPWRGLAVRRYASMLRKADVLTFPSAATLRATALPQRPGTQMRVAYPAVDLPTGPDDRSRMFYASLNPSPETRFLAFAGPLHYAQKARGVMDLVRALGLLRKEGRDVRLVIAGDGRYRKNIEALASRIAPHAVIFSGVLQEPSLVIGGTDLYTHISYLEGLPLAVLEAMAAARCVVASPTGGIPEVIENGKTGVLAAGSPQEIAQVIGRLLDDPSAAQRIGQAAATRIRKEFLWSGRAAEFLQLYGVS